MLIELAQMDVLLRGEGDNHHLQTLVYAYILYKTNIIKHKVYSPIPYFYLEIC